MFIMQMKNTSKFLISEFFFQFNQMYIKFGICMFSFLFFFKYWLLIVMSIFFKSCYQGSKVTPIKYKKFSQL